MNELIFCLMGPTASGKTELAAKLSERFPFSLISVDSTLVYRDMNIGSAKPTPEFLSKFPHALIDIREPSEPYAVSDFCADVHEEILNIRQSGKMPLLVGGTMMYFRALQKGLSSLPSADAIIRKKIESEALDKGWSAMHDELVKCDPQRAKAIHPNDRQRISRALEVFLLTGTSMEEAVTKEKTSLNFINMALFPEDRRWLHEKIDARFRVLINDGLLAEVQQLMRKYPHYHDYPAFRSVGYRQAIEHLEGLYDKNTFIDKGIAATRQLAKRQLTWLRSWPLMEYFLPENANCYSEIVAFIEKILDNSTNDF